MISTDNLCMSCMREIGSARQCPYCGYHTDSAQISPYLPVRTVIANRYLVGKLVDYNGEGATYIGWDLIDKKAINIREFIPEGISTRTTSDLTLRVMPGSELVFRDCMQSFGELWNKLLRLQGLAALICVTDIVEAFGTLYAVSDHIEGVTLREYLLTSKTGYVSWNKALGMLLPILSTLGTLHSSGIIHRGISPSTLLVGRDGKIRITGFSIWQARTSRGDLNAQLYPGYSAIEQYGFEGQQGPWTDVYAFGAVLYRTLIGSDPIDATERVANDRLMVPGKFAETLPNFVINGLINSLQILPEDRTRTIDRLRAELSGNPAASAPQSELYSKNIAPVVINDKPEAPAPKKKNSAAAKNNRFVALKAAIISIVAGLLVFLLLVFTVFREDFGIGTKEETSTSVTQNNGSEYIPVPDFFGKSYLDVQSNPVFTSLYTFEVQYTYSDSVASGYIVNQSIAADTQVIEGTTITLYVSKGKEKVTLPAEIIGQDYDTVYERLVSLGFEVERKDVDDEEGCEDNEVISASPKEGNAYDKGTKVTLKVFKAPDDPTQDTTFDLGTPSDEPSSDLSGGEMPSYDYPIPSDHEPEPDTQDSAQATDEAVY